MALNSFFLQIIYSFWRPLPPLWENSHLSKGFVHHDHCIFIIIMIISIIIDCIEDSVCNKWSKRRYSHSCFCYKVIFIIEQWNHRHSSSLRWFLVEIYICLNNPNVFWKILGNVFFWSFYSKSKGDVCVISLCWVLSVLAFLFYFPRSHVSHVGVPFKSFVFASLKLHTQKVPKKVEQFEFHKLRLKKFRINLFSNVVS